MREIGYLQVVIRSGDLHLLEEDFRHIGIKVLACMHDDFFDVVTRLDDAADRRGLDELRAGAEDGEDFQVLFLCVFSNFSLICAPAGGDVPLV